jgi:branched-chain amino acid transport system substrate-binding protein
LSGPRAAEGRDLADGARLALAEADGEAAGTAVALTVRDDATKSGWDAARTGENARAATEDATAIAFIGELDSGATRTSVPITNGAGMLQVSAGSGAEGLVREAPGSSQVPSDAQPSGERTFARVIPSDVAQGEAAGEWMAALGLTSVQVVDEDGPFSEAVVAGLESVGDAPAISAGDPDAIFYARATVQEEGGGGVMPGGGVGEIFGTDAQLDEEDLTTLQILREICRSASDCPSSPRGIHLTSAALDPSQLPVAADGFLAAFEDEYGRRPGRYAAYGYEAMAAILDAIGRADDPLDRGAVTDAFFAIEGRESILGEYSIDSVGNTTLAQLGAYDVRDGKAVAVPEPLQLP